MASDTDIAWAAGLFEGEGWFHKTVHPKSKKVYGRMGIKMTDLDVLERFQAIVGCGSILKMKPSLNPRHKQQYQWYTSQAEHLRKMTRMLGPYFCERRKQQMDELLAQCSPITQPWHTGPRGMGLGKPGVHIEGQTSLGGT